MPQADSLALFEEDGRALRDPAQVIPLPTTTQFQPGERLAHRVRGDFWGVLARLQIRLLVTREYEHLLLSLGVSTEWPAGRVVAPAATSVRCRRGPAHRQRDRRADA